MDNFDLLVTRHLSIEGGNHLVVLTNFDSHIRNHLFHSPIHGLYLAASPINRNRDRLVFAGHGDTPTQDDDGGDTSKDRRHFRAGASMFPAHVVPHCVAGTDDSVISLTSL